MVIPLVFGGNSRLGFQLLGSWCWICVREKVRGIRPLRDVLEHEASGIVWACMLMIQWTKLLRRPASSRPLLHRPSTVIGNWPEFCYIFSDFHIVNLELWNSWGFLFGPRVFVFQATITAAVATNPFSHLVADRCHIFWSHGQEQAVNLSLVVWDCSQLDLRDVIFIYIVCKSHF